MTCGIYLITNNITGQKYVGQSNNIERRWKEHKRGSDKSLSRIDRAMLKHGSNNFSLEIITQLPNDEALLNSHEIYWIKFYNTYKDNFHYNLTEGGETSPMKNPEIVKKVIANRVDQSGENNPFFNKVHSEESKQLISQSRKGKCCGEDNPNYGKKYSPEEKLKRAIAHSSKTNKLSYFRVSTTKSKTCKQGFQYRYRYKDVDGNDKAIYSISLDKLKEKVLAKGLEWIEFVEGGDRECSWF